MSTDNQNNGTPPTGHDWGERTSQSVTYTAPGHWKSDAYEMGQRYGITDIDIEEFTEINEDAIVYPDLVIHERSPTETETKKGTNALIRGKKKGCGKSTLLKHLGRQMMSHNGSRIIWRGSPKRSEWLAFRNWTTLYLPANAEVDARWMDEESDRPVSDVDDLEDIVRDVVYYDSVQDLLQTIGDRPEGTFNVIYPDPSFAGCEDVFKQTDTDYDDLPFTPRWEADEDNPQTSLIHWWYAFIVARVYLGPFQDWVLMFDETGDITPSRSETKQDDQRTFDKVAAVRAALADSRRAFLTFVFATHHETQIFDEVRREFDWRIHMPDGSPNPTKDYKSSIPLGFDTVPMQEDIMSGKDVGTALCYAESGFTLFQWEDVPPEPGDEARFLQIRLSAPARRPDALAQEESNTPETVEFDDTVMKEWENQHYERLYVKQPGEGYVSITNQRIEEDLVSPVEDLEFVDHLVEAEDALEVRMVDGDGNEIVVARIPDSSAGFKSASEVGGVGA